MKAFAAAAIVALGLGSLGVGPARPSMRGYTPLDGARERLIEQQFIDIPAAQAALEDAAVIGARPHYAGTPADYALATFMRDQMRSYGLSAEREPFSARVDTPRELVLELAPAVESTAPRKGRRAAFPIALNLAEAPEPSDPATAARNVGLPFIAGSGDGDVSAPLVYVDRGRDADYQTLERAGVDVRGAVVLARYGAQARGLLAQRAQARGAAGIVFYDDPKDDGSGRGTEYPRGPWRPPSAVERGSVGPGISIPALPISAANAQVLLGALRGAAGPPDWGGALPIDYPLARGPGRVHLIVKLNRKTTTLWNTIGIIPGVHPDESVILGAHRDAWVYGVGDDGAGITIMLEVARGFGFLVQGGWRPQRSIIIAGWDGAEIGLAGSRAYVTRHRFEIERGCFGYLNADKSVTGTTFVAAAAAAIAPVVLEASLAVRDPAAPATTIYDRWAAQSARGAPAVDIPSGGSDGEPFLTGAGIPIADLAFRGPFGVDHSSYDTLNYATLFSDPDFLFHRAAAQLYGVVALRLADADLVPYAFGGYVRALRAAGGRLAATAAVPLNAATTRFAAQAARFERITPDPAAGIRELRAVRELDSVVYGLSGQAGTPLPALAAEAMSGDAGRVNAAVTRAAAAIDRAASALAAGS